MNSEEMFSWNSEQPSGGFLNSLALWLTSHMDFHVNGTTFDSTVREFLGSGVKV